MRKEKSINYEKGHELEKKMEEFFRLNGYSTKRNVVLEGKSGGKHEIDILAKKSDGVTTFEIIIECKAWNKPIEKDVVSKVNYVMRDLGINKAIIVSLRGWRVGAEKAAKQLGIELWGRSEIENKLGKTVLAKLETSKFKKITKGFPVIMDESKAKAMIEKESRGFLGFGREKIKWIKLIWIPCYLFQISLSQKEGILRRKIKTTKIWNIYDALSGHWIITFLEKPNLHEIEITAFPYPQIKGEKVKNNILRTFDKMVEVIRPSSKQRYIEKLAKLGIPHSINAINIDEITAIFYPFYIGLLEKNNMERIVAVDSVLGKVNTNVGTALTTHLTYVLESLG